SAASTSVSSTGNRPPPSKSTTANTIGGLGEYASLSMVNVTIVPSVSAIGAAGGRRRDARGFGPARRLDRDHAPPREELAVGEIAARADLRGHRPRGA